YPEGGGSIPSLAAIARWPRIEARGRKPRHGGESPSRASTSIRCDGASSFRQQHLRVWNHPLKADRVSVGTGLAPEGSRIDPVVVVQRRGCEHATLAMRVRLPPATLVLLPTINEGGGDMPTT